MPRDQWLEIGSECPHCGERITEEQVYSLRPIPEDPKLGLLYCVNCGRKIEINFV
jgi:transcription elongation factor Elf1